MSELNNSFSTQTHNSAFENDYNSQDMVSNTSQTSEYSNNDDYVETLNVFLHMFPGDASNHYQNIWGELSNFYHLVEQNPEYEDEHLRSVSNLLYYSNYRDVENRRRFDNFLSMSFNDRARQIEELYIKLNFDEEDLASLLSNALQNNALRNESYHNLLDMLEKIELKENISSEDNNINDRVINALIAYCKNRNTQTRPPKIDTTCRDNQFLGNKRDRDPDDKDPEGGIGAGNKELLNRLMPFYKLQITHQSNAKQK